jgi:hypothetical protein
MPKKEDFDTGFEEQQTAESPINTTIGEIIDETLKRRPKEPKKNYDLPEKWALIRLEQKRQEYDIDDVPVCCNGHNVLLKRGMWVPINWAFVEVLKNAKHPQYHNKPGEQRKVVGMVTRFPYQGPFEITKEEFKQLRKSAMKGEIPASEYPERYRSMIEAA